MGLWYIPVEVESRRDGGKQSIRDWNSSVILIVSSLLFRSDGGEDDDDDGGVGSAAKIRSCTGQWGNWSTTLVGVVVVAVVEVVVVVDKTRTADICAMAECVTKNTDSCWKRK